MPTMFNVNEAKTKFSNILANVENNLVTITIMRYGHPIAQIVPIKRQNRTKTDPLLSCISYSGNLCENEADDWEEA
jgi:antitoxin (DNA-binding transcriptional repressor) of toxin-antitoxin stability system